MPNYRLTAPVTAKLSAAARPARHPATAATAARLAITTVITVVARTGRGGKSRVVCCIRGGFRASAGRSAFCRESVRRSSLRGGIRERPLRETVRDRLRVPAAPHAFADAKLRTRLRFRTALRVCPRGHTRRAVRNASRVRNLHACERERCGWHRGPIGREKLTDRAGGSHRDGTPAKATRAKESIAARTRETHHGRQASDRLPPPAPPGGGPASARSGGRSGLVAARCGWRYTPAAATLATPATRAAVQVAAVAGCEACLAAYVGSCSTRAAGELHPCAAATRSEPASKATLA